MKLRLVIAMVVALGLAAAGWLDRGRHVSVLFSRDSTPDAATTLQAAGVHKCVGAGGTRYIDGTCPAGTREVAATGGTVTVTSFPKPAPPRGPGASAAFGGPLVKPMDPDERDRLREKAIDDAMNRR